MDKQKICERANITRAWLDIILAGKGRPSSDLAKVLEEETGVQRMAWLYPDEHENPYLKKTAA